MKRLFLFAIFMAGAFFQPKAFACTGITLQTASSSPVTARTIEWAAQPLSMMYVVVPRGHRHVSQLPDGTKQGLRYFAKYGYVGIAVEDQTFVMEGLNEAGLSAGLFYFPDYGEYQPYDSAYKGLTISDMQFVSWVLASFANIDDLLARLNDIRVVGIDPRASTVHWRITDSSGRQVVLEIINQKMIVHDNPLGVLTNSPSLPWHRANLNNYVNLQPGSVQQKEMRNLVMKAFSGGSGMLGLPGDMTSPSRFVRAAFMQSTAPIFDDAEQTVVQAFHILSAFNIPIGMQFGSPDLVPDMHSATQITVASDLVNRRLYFRTMYNAVLRCIDLYNIDFDQVAYQVEYLEYSTLEPIEYIEVY